MSLVWYCIRTARHRETMARDSLAALPDIKARLPIYPTIQGRGDERRRVDLPLIPRHLFVGVPQNQNRFAGIERARGIVEHESGRRGAVELGISFLRLTPASPPATVRIADMARLDTAEGELIDEVEKRLAAYRLEAERRARRLANPRLRPPDDTDEIIERLKSTQPEERARALFEMLGRGAQARLRLSDLQQVA